MNPGMLLPFCLVLFSIHAFAQGNGKLQLRFVDVGQGDGALLISNGETILFDDGVSKVREPLEYLRGLGLSKIRFMPALPTGTPCQDGRKSIGVVVAEKP